MNSVIVAAFSAALATLPLASTASAGNASTSDALQWLRPEVQCMVKVLGTTSGVDDVRSRASQTDGHIEAFVEYRYRENNGQVGTVRFVAYQSANSNNSVYFQAVLKGLTTPSGPGPSDFGAMKIARLWKSKCHVSVLTLYQ